MRARAEYRRRFGYAVAVSVVVHAIALYGGWPNLRESLEEPVAPPPLVTRLVELPKPAEPAPAPPEEKTPPAPRRDLRKPAAKPLPEPTPVPEVTRDVARAPAPPAPPQPAPLEPPVTTAPPQPQAENRAAEAATAAQYRLQLIAYAQRNKPPYPAIARENNWTGDVVLEIVIRADGRAELGLRRGSGHAVLDKLALDTYQEALRAVPVPPTLRGKQVALQPLRVIYNLTE
jgi:TonB family protein